MTSDASSKAAGSPARGALVAFVLRVSRAEFIQQSNSLRHILEPGSTNKIGPSKLKGGNTVEDEHLDFESICLHPVELAYVDVLTRAAWPVAKALQLIVFGSLSNPFADRISVAD